MSTETAPLIDLAQVVKQHQGGQPLRLAQFQVRPGERFVLAGLDAGAAEAFVMLVTGAAVPDAGDVRVSGRSTREIATDTEWLLSLDRFGLVTRRAVLIDALPIAQNLALPMTLSIDPMPPDIAARVSRLAADAGLAAERLPATASTLTPDERVRVHLARALALDPALVLLEHPTVGLEAAASRALGAQLRALSDGRDLAWVAITDDEEFARASGGTRLRLKPATGALVPDRFWHRWS